MRKVIAVILLLIVFSASQAVFAAAQTATVKSATGKVEYRTDGAWSAAKSGMDIPLGATISTGFDSTAVLEIGTATLEVKPLTRMRLDQLAEKDGVVSTDLFLQVGRIKTEVKSVQGLQNNFTLKSPVTTASVRGTGFDFDGVNIKVDNGNVLVTNRMNHTNTYRAGESGSSSGLQPPAGGAKAREAEIVVRADTSDLLGGGDVTDAPPAGSTGTSGPGYGSIKVSWEFTPEI